LPALFTFQRQRQLAAHVKAGLCVVLFLLFAGHWRFLVP
jgi:hypothetical protein